MDLRDLRYFIAVYEAEGFSRASRALGTVQSNVSARIRNLEESLGVELFRRRHRNVAPTAKGETLYRHARKVMNAVSHAETAIRRPRRVRGFTLLELLVVVVDHRPARRLRRAALLRPGRQVRGRHVAKAQLDALEKALDQYRLDVGRYPEQRARPEGAGRASRRARRSGTAPT